MELDIQLKPIRYDLTSVYDLAEDSLNQLVEILNSETTWTYDRVYFVFTNECKTQINFWFELLAYVAQSCPSVTSQQAYSISVRGESSSAIEAESTRYLAVQTRDPYSYRF